MLAYSMDADELRAIRAAGQRLDTGRRPGSASDVVRHLVAVQAQDMAAAALGVAVRADDLTIAALDAARNEERSIVRLWCLRGTLHLVAAEDAHWMLELVRPRLGTANRRRRAELGLDDADTERGVRVIAQSLEADGPLTRAQIAERLRRSGIASEGQATIHLIWRAAVDGLVCYGPDHEGEETFVTLDDWVPVHQRASPPDAALEVARRYIAAYGPATDEDFGVWSGLPRREVSRAWSALRTEVSTVSTPYGEMLLSGRPAVGGHRVLRLLPGFDGLWVGYRQHEVFLQREYHGRVFPGGGIIRSVVFADSHIAGVWARRAAGQRVDVSVDLFEAVDQDALAAAVADYGRIVERAVRLVPEVTPRR
ncbi:MAG: AlkZ family DNA glycosylase [Chloroflexi bacterium]|nr:AlkZ family DNA glycosylase [Chloroflexota bacterium]